MSTYQIYFSPTQHTERITEIITNTFESSSKIDLTDKMSATSKIFSEEDICIIGVPSYGGRVPSIALERMNHYQGNNAKAILLVSYGNRAYEDTLKELQEFLTSKGFQCIAAIAAVAEHSIMHQFATGRPDMQDKKELFEFAEKIRSKINENEFSKELHLPGNNPYREYHGVPLKPKVGKQCSMCGICANKCPVGAIDVNNPKVTNKDMCISCMRCIEICPSHAREVSDLKLKIAATQMKKTCSDRKENELFY